MVIVLIYYVVNGNNLNCCGIYQDGVPCNLDHYSSIGKNTFILLLKCFLCLTIGSKRKEFGLPMRNTSMAHGYKLAATLDDSTIYIDWCKELDVSVELTKLTEEKKALAILSSLIGKPKQLYN